VPFKRFAPLSTRLIPAAYLKLVGLIHLAAENSNGPLWSHAENAVVVSG
jgi:hypothetical protein